MTDRANTTDAVASTLPAPILATALLLASSALSLVIIVAWWWLPLAVHLPVGWDLMKFNSALGLLFVAVGLAAARSGHHWLVWTAALSLSVVAGSALRAHALDAPGVVELAFADDALAPLPGLMSLRSAFFLLLMVPLLLLLNRRGGFLGGVADTLLALALSFCIVMLSGHIFHAVSLVGRSEATLTSPQALFCMMLLTIAALLMRAELGFFGVYLGKRTGSRMVRNATPITVGVLLAYFALTTAANAAGFWLPTLDMALLAAMVALVFFWLLLWMGHRLNALERDILSAAPSAPPGEAGPTDSDRPGE